jgi:hypothetical protein
MKRLTVVSGICASCLLGTAMTAVAQGQDEHRNDKNDKQENARPENRQEEARPQEARAARIRSHRVEIVTRRTGRMIDRCRTGSSSGNRKTGSSKAGNKSSRGRVGMKPPGRSGVEEISGVFLTQISRHTLDARTTSRPDACRSTTDSRSFITPVTPSH